MDWVKAPLNGYASSGVQLVRLVAVVAVRKARSSKLVTKGLSTHLLRTASRGGFSIP